MKININHITEKKTEVNIHISNDETYNHKDIIALKEARANGFIYRDYEDQITLDLEVEGVMVIEDAVTLDPVDYSFSFSIEEKFDSEALKEEEYFEKEQNILDIIPILWQNIVLEVPIAYSLTSADEITVTGECWQVKKEELPNIDPRMAPLAKLLDIEKE